MKVNRTTFMTAEELEQEAKEMAEMADLYRAGASNFHPVVSLRTAIRVTQNGVARRMAQAASKRQMGMA